MVRERLAVVAIIASIGVIAFGVLRPASIDPQGDLRAARTRFFLGKIDGDPVHDLVVIGDSRALRGISPEEMERSLDGYSVFNFAFDAGGFNREIFAAAERLLDPDSPHPTILIAPTALGFIPWKQTNGQYREYKAKPWDERILYMDFYEVADFFRPLPPSEIVRWVTGQKPKVRTWERFHDDGWIATRQTPFDEFTDLTVLREQLEGNIADPDVVAGLIEQIETWTAKGISVVGCAVPAYGKRVAMEDSMLQFDRDAFVRSFVEAGGIYLDDINVPVVTYDGSHLEEGAARQFSRLLGEAIAGTSASGRDGREGNRRGGTITGEASD